MPPFTCVEVTSAKDWTDSVSLIARVSVLEGYSVGRKVERGSCEHSVLYGLLKLVVVRQ